MKTSMIPESLQRRCRAIDEILDSIESERNDTITPERFIKDLEFELIAYYGDCHISRTVARRAGNEWKRHAHEGRAETIVVANGEGEVYHEDEDGKEVKKILLVGDSIKIPVGTMHGGRALVDNTTIISVVVPADEAVLRLISYLESTKNGRQ